MTTPPVIGHRGACGHAPENTLTSFRKAADLGAAWVEFDTKLSADHRVVVIHDETLKRTTGAPGRVADTSFENLQKLDAGKWFADDFAGETIPDLASVVELLKELNLGAVIEIKPSKGQDAETARLTAEMVRNNWPAGLPTPLLSSFSKPALDVAKACAPEIPRALNVDKIRERTPDDLQALECTALHCRHDRLNQTPASEILKAGYDLRCYTVNQPERAKILFDWGVQAIFTDFPDRFL